MAVIDYQSPPNREKVYINAGCGPSWGVSRSNIFSGWREVRVDIDPSVQPDVIASVTDLSPIRDGFADAIWSSHCLEHLFLHQVSGALAEFRRVITKDGFVIFLVPDVQAVADRVATDKFHETVYESTMGPVTAHDMFYGFGPSIAEGHASMAHRCGFTPTMLVNLMNGTNFAEYAIRRLPTLELVVLARKTRGDATNNCEAMLRALSL